MKTFYAVIFSLLFYCTAQSQSFTFPTSGNAVNSQLSPLVADDGVTLIPSIRSTGCTPGASSTFSYSTSHLSTGAIYRNTRWAAGCKNSTDLIKLDFSTVNKRPLGLKFSIFDVDNGADSVSVEIYSAGVRINYTYTLYSPTYINANGSSPQFGFRGSGNNNSGQDDNSGRIDIITYDPLVSIDSVIVYKHNSEDISGNPSQSIAGFDWTSSSTLPIKLVSFSVNRDADLIQFKWKVAEEIGTRDYQIEYSQNGYNYFAAGNKIAAKGTLNGKADYLFSIAALPQSDVLYFRLLSIDIDGRKYYSKTIKLSDNRIIKTEAYPSNFKNNFSVAIQSENTYTGKLKLIGLDGRIVYQKDITLSKGKNLIPVQISSEISRGMYIVVGEFGEEISFRHKLIKE